MLKTIWSRHLPPMAWRTAKMMAFTGLSPKDNDGQFRHLDDCDILIFPYDTNLSLDWNHWAIACALSTQLGWQGEVSGGKKDYPGRTRRFTFTS